MKHMMLLCGLMTSAAVLDAGAETYYSATDDTAAVSSFSRANWRKPGDSTASSPSAGHDYVATNLVNCGNVATASGVSKFPGDSLQIGISGGQPGKLGFKNPGYNVCIPNLILANGYLFNNQTVVPTAVFSNCVATVKASASAPFVIGMDGSGYWGNRNLSFVGGFKFKGGEDSAVEVRLPKNVLTLEEGSPDYLGKWAFTSERYLKVVLGSASALGGDRLEYAADAIKVSSSGQHTHSFVLDFDGRMPSEGRGMTISSDVVLNVTTGKVECTMPVIRSGTTGKLLVAGGACALKTPDISSTWAEPIAGYVSDGRDALMLGAVAVPVEVNSGTLCVTNFTGGSFILKSKARLAVRIHRDGTADTTAFAEGSTVTFEDAKIPIHVYGTFPLTNATTRIAALKIPVGTREVSADDFTVTADDFDLMEKTLAVETEGGMQTVYITMTGRVVYYSKYNSYATYDMGAGSWSDNSAVHPDADYLIGYDVDSSCRSIRSLTEAKAFGGRSLTLSHGATLALKRQTNVADLRCWPGSTLRVNEDFEMHLAGGISLRGNPADGGVDLILAYDKTVHLASELSGCSSLRIRNSNGGGKYRICEILHENPRFLGSIETVLSEGNATRGIELVIGDELNLGGNPAVFNPGQLLFNCQTRLTANSSFSIDDSNRGLTVNAASSINVPADKVLVLDVPVSINAGLRKEGEGTLGIGGTVSGSADGLVVLSGWIRPVSKAGSCALKYTFADGSGLDLDLYPSDADIASDGLYIEDVSHFNMQGSSLPVVIEGTITKNDKSVKLGIMNVPAEMADEIGNALGSEVVFRNVSSGSTRRFGISRESLDGGRVRFFSKIFVPGFMLILR